MPGEPSVVAARVRRAILESGLTQQAMAEIAGMDPTALSKVLSGRRRLSALEFALIAEATGLSVGELLGSESAAERIAARAQPKANPAVSEALSRVKDLLEIDVLLCDVGIPAPPSVLPLKISGRRMVDQAAKLARDVREVA